MIYLDWKKYFEDITLIQGSGGNFSFKEKDALIIKPSGTNLKDIDSRDYTRIKICKSEFLSDQEVYENYWKRVIISGEKPSMEYGFHLLLSRYVFHFHDLTTVCHDLEAYNELKKALDIFGINIDYIRYLSPGYDLTVGMEEMLKNNDKKTDIIFLQNHGIIITAESETKLQYLMTRYMEIRNNQFKTISFSDVPNDKLIQYAERFILNGNFYFPDEAIFIHGKFCLSTKSTEEIIFDLDDEGRRILSYLYLANEAFSSNSSKKLKRMEYEKLVSLPSEKFRINKLKT